MNKLCILFVGLAIPTVLSTYPKSHNSYHAMVGIPLAKRIRDAEARRNAASDWSLVDRTMGGARAPQHAYPYLAGLLIDLVGTRNQSVCGSSILTANHVVTAAHCCWDTDHRASQITVIMGSNYLYNDGVRMTTSHVIVHPEWNIHNIQNDIAMIYLPRNIYFSDNIHPIDLPSGLDWSNDFVGHLAIAAGFGSTHDDHKSSPFLSHIALRVITNHECLAFYGHNLITPGKLCTDGAEGIGACFGDSGGPLAIYDNGRPILIGITSFVSDISCKIGHPSAFTRITDYYDFIMQHL